MSVHLLFLYFKLFKQNKKKLTLCNSASTYWWQLRHKNLRKREKKNTKLTPKFYLWTSHVLHMSLLPELQNFAQKIIRHFSKWLWLKIEVLNILMQLNQSSMTYVLGSSFADLLMWQSWNFEFLIGQTRKLWPKKPYLFLSFKLVLRSGKKHNKYYVIFKIQNSNFSTLANQ